MLARVQGTVAREVAAKQEEADSMSGDRRPGSLASWGCERGRASSCVRTVVDETRARNGALE